MGPYCDFCGHRCFIYMPAKTPEHILRAYGETEIIATCPDGQYFERKKVGYCYDDIKPFVEIARLEAQNAQLLEALKECYQWLDGLRKMVTSLNDLDVSVNTESMDLALEHGRAAIAAAEKEG